MKRTAALVLLILFPVFCTSGLADVTLGSPFQDHAVLQRGKPISVWGMASPGEKITVQFHEQKKEATADSSGKWQVMLDSESVSATSSELTVAGKNTVKISDVLVGEVWICAGQSNMAWTVEHSKDADKEVPAAQYPLIRHFKVALTAAAAPSDTAIGSWEVCSPTDVGNFTAVGYFFGRDLFQQLNVPIGLLNITYGGSPIESWMSDAILHSNPAFAPVFDRVKRSQDLFPARQKLYEKRMAEWQAAHDAAVKDNKSFTGRQPVAPTETTKVDRFTPSALYNAMVHPFIPYGARGIIWFQGEANFLRSDEYRVLFPTMISEWRTEFGQGDLPFYYVQLANQARKSDATGVQFAFQRDAQSMALKLPNTGFAVTADIGEPDNPHFKNKQEVGRRLSLVALNNIYDIKGEYAGPTVKEITTKGADIRVTFTHADGLKLTGDATGGFEVAGADKVFQPATAKIDGNAVVVTSSQVKEPVALRYAWHNNPSMILYNGAGLPASPFRSDDWSVPKAATAAAAESTE